MIFSEKEISLEQFEIDKTIGEWAFTTVNLAKQKKCSNCFALKSVQKNSMNNYGW